jgi:hypothetical protein
MNLLSNACKFTSDGIIEISAWLLNPNEVKDALALERKKLCRDSILDQDDQPARSRLYI